jgi:hypothetical protein
MISQCENEIRILESREERAMSEEEIPLTAKRINCEDTQAKPVYRKGDRVTIELDEDDAHRWNAYGCSPWVITSHIPAPEPVVRWCNVYADRIGVMNHSEIIADEFFTEGRIAKVKITITGDDVKAEVVKV